MRSLSTGHGGGASCSPPLCICNIRVAALHLGSCRGIQYIPSRSNSPSKRCTDLYWSSSAGVSMSVFYVWPRDTTGGTAPDE